MNLEYKSHEGRHYCDYTGTQYPRGDPKSENRGIVNVEWRSFETEE